MLNKSFITNFLAFAIIVTGYLSANSIIFNIGLFAFSGALTNWLAVHMLFEKIPGLYGSGVIPNRFEEFKIAIKNLIMDEFFSQQNIDNFFADKNQLISSINFSAIIHKIDISPAFEKLIQVIAQSSFGSMLSMFGGVDALQPLKQPFVDNMKAALIEITEKDSFIKLMQSEIEQNQNLTNIKLKIASIVDNRLAELTPQLVKQIVQKMIKRHLGWLVVWGGFFGGLIGFFASLIKL